MASQLEQCTVDSSNSVLEEASAAGLVKGPPVSDAPHKAVVVHGGARDAYQLALALSDRGMLEVLVTDLLWPTDRGWARLLERWLPGALRSLLRQRSAPGLPFSRVRLCVGAGLRSLLAHRLPHVPFSTLRGSQRAADATLGRSAGRYATQTGAGLVSYSYFGFDAFSNFRGAGILFQLHPHPLTVRRILREELRKHPDCKDSLNQEWELALPPEDFGHLVDETKMASNFLVASSFTRNSLVEHGTDPKAIRVVPYGVDLERFHPAVAARPASSASPAKLRLLFVGRINQRKGVKYLLEALRLIGPDRVELTICGRVVAGLELFRPFASQIEIRPSVSNEELVAAYQAADLFVFPSVAEGFGQVLLEALACGLPILSTTSTAAPDLIEDGVQGFVIEPSRSDLLAERIEWALTHRVELAAMRPLARERAELFTWKRFRADVADAVGSFMNEAVMASGKSL